MFKKFLRALYNDRVAAQYSSDGNNQCGRVEREPYSTDVEKRNTSVITRTFIEDIKLKMSRV